MYGWIIAIVVVLVAGIVWMSRGPKDSAVLREKYLLSLTDYLEGRKEPLEGFNNSYRITFSHEGFEFNFEDIEDAGIRTTFYKGFLTVKSRSRLSLTFTEKEAATFRTKAKTIKDLSSGWGMDSVLVHLPPELKRFGVYTNDPPRAGKLVADSRVTGILADCSNEDKFGHPLMSMEIIDGMLILRFHPPGILKPTLYDLRHNVTTIDPFLDDMAYIVKKLNAIEAEMTS